MLEKEFHKDRVNTRDTSKGVVEEWVSDQYDSLLYGSGCIQLSTCMLKMPLNVPDPWKTNRKSFTLKTRKNRLKMNL